MVWFYILSAQVAKNVKEERFAIGDNALVDFVSVDLAAKRIISHYIAEVVYDLRGCEY